MSSQSNSNFAAFLTAAFSLADMMLKRPFARLEMAI
jgi:hypothetical protein